jgi:hypothetical protein
MNFWEDGDIEKVKGHLNRLSLKKEKILYLEEWIHFSEQFEVEYGPHSYQKTLSFVKNELRHLYKLVELEDGEKNVIKTSKNFTHDQQMLLIERTGINKFLEKYNLTAEKKAILISRIIGKGQQNTREFLGTMNDKKHKDTCNTPENNKLIDQFFSELGIS